ncbi:MAG TPA: hypothetical protein VM597_07155, partial [Gemmataceae bacterium]|nr:hypothetical protein [Gemmataceae bacterium]
MTFPVRRPRLALDPLDARDVPAVLVQWTGTTGQLAMQIDNDSTTAQNVAVRANINGYLVINNKEFRTPAGKRVAASKV